MLVHDSSSLGIQFIYMYFTGIPRRNGSLTVHEQARAGQSVQRVLVGQKPDAEANELEHRTSEPPVLFIQVEQQEQLAVQYGPVCI